MLPYHGKKGDYAIKSMTKKFTKLFQETVTTKITFTGRKLGSRFNIKNETNDTNEKLWFSMENV